MRLTHINKHRLHFPCWPRSQKSAREHKCSCSLRFSFSFIKLALGTPTICHLSQHDSNFSTDSEKPKNLNPVTVTRTKSPHTHTQFMTDWRHEVPSISTRYWSHWISRFHGGQSAALMLLCHSLSALHSPSNMAPTRHLQLHSLSRCTWTCSTMWINRLACSKEIQTYRARSIIYLCAPRISIQNVRGDKVDNDYIRRDRQQQSTESGCAWREGLVEITPWWAVWWIDK